MSVFTKFRDKYLSPTLAYTVGGEKGVSLFDNYQKISQNKPLDVSGKTAESNVTGNAGSLNNFSKGMFALTILGVVFTGMLLLKRQG